MTEEQSPDFARATDITMQAYQEIASDYAERHRLATQPSLWQENLQSFTDHVRANQRQAEAFLPVLDVGCGPGRDSLLLAQAGFEVLATDLSEAMLAEAHLRCLNQPGAERIHFQQSDMRHLDLPDASCSGIWASASFLHIPKQESRAVLRELRRVLTSGSPLLLILKEADGGPDERFETIWSSSPPRFFARYHGGELWELLEQAGWHVLSLTASPDKRSTTGQRWLTALALKNE